MGSGPDLHIERDTVEINGLPYIVPRVNWQQLGSFFNKQTFGDYSRDSDNLISAKVWSDFTGGLGTFYLREGTDDASFEDSTCHTMSPYELSLPLNSHLAATGPNRGLGDLFNRFYACSDTTLYRWEESTSTWTSIGGITTPATARAGVIAGKLVIPQGGSGYQTYDGTTITAQSALAKPIAVLHYNNALYSLSSTGVLSHTLDGVNWFTDVTIDSYYTPKTMTVYMDSQGYDAIYISTTRGLLAWDSYAGILVMARLVFPPHPDNGLGLAHWRPGEDLYMTAGLNVWRFTGTATGEIGPHKPHGLPYELRGAIIDLMPSHNEMFALVRGIAVTTTTEDPASGIDWGETEEGELEYSPILTQSSIIKWTKTGWHHTWRSPSPMVVYWMNMSDAEGAYKLWWGTSDGLFYQNLPKYIHNPRQLIATTEGDFASTCLHKTGYFDANMPRFDKLASHVEVNVSRKTPLVTDFNLLRSIDEEDYEVMSAFDYPPATTRGTYVFPFGLGYVDNDQSGFSYGEIFNRIAFQLAITGPGGGDSLVIDSIVLKFIKVPLQGESFWLDIDLQKTATIFGRDPNTIKAEINSLVTSKTFVRFRHGSSPVTSHRVYLGRGNGWDATADDPSGFRRVALISVPLNYADGSTTLPVHAS